MEKRSFSYGQKNIDYTIFFMDRKTLEIAVHPDTFVIVKAPLGTEIPEIEKKLKKRARWIRKQICFFCQFQPKTPERQYLSGETHLYLGKQYRLKIFSDSKNSVKLTRGFFQVTCKNKKSKNIKRLLDKWYREKANVQFYKSLDRCWKSFSAIGLAKPNILIRCMKKRWGSLSKKGLISLNPKLIKAPKDCIDYVITHELCHLKHRNHGPEFYNLLNTIMPSWEKLKHKLEITLI